MSLPDYWIERPSFRATRATEAAVEAFLELADSNDGTRLLDVEAFLREEPPHVVRWQFLCSLAARRRIAFHGTGDPHIERFEPREPVDFAPFGRQQAVFATSDPIWAMFYAIVDRPKLTLNNGCLVLEDTGEAYYYFSVSRQALGRRPWRTGHLYLLPADTFVEQPGDVYAGRPAHVPQLASASAVTPFARLRVAPRSFPFLGRIRGHDDERLADYARAVMTAAAWPE